MCAWLFIVAAAAAQTTVAVSGHVQIPDSSAPANTKIRFELIGCSNGQARVDGVAIFSDYHKDFDVIAGAFTGTLYPNTSVDCNGTIGSTQYNERFLVNGQPTGPAVPYTVGPGAFVLESGTPAQTSPAVVTATAVVTNPQAAALQTIHGPIDVTAITCLGVACAGNGGGGYSLIKSAGTSLAVRSTLNFFSGIICADNASPAQTNCQIDQGFSPTWTAAHTFNASVNLAGGLKINGAAAAGKIPIGDGTNFVPGDPLVQGLNAEGSTATNNPVNVGGFDTAGTPAIHGTKVLNSAPAGTEYGIVTRPIPSGTQPVSGTVTANQGGTWTVQPGNTANTTAWKVDGSAVTQPVSGTVTANAGTGTFNIQANASMNQTQVAGTAIDVNSGVKSSGTQRIVIATDQPQLTNALKVDGSAVTQPVSGTVTANAGTGNFTVAQATGSNLHMTCDSGCSSSAGFADNGAFTTGTTAVNPSAGLFDDTPPTAVTTGHASAARITPNRALHINLRNQAGTEIATSSNPVRTDPTGTTTQPVSGTVTATQATGTNLHMVCDSGCSSSAGFADNAAFTTGTTAINPVGGLFDDTPPTAIATGHAASARITNNRALHINIRNQAGTEIATSSNPVRTDPTGTTTQPVSGTVTANQGGTWTVQPGNTANTTAWKVDGSAVTQPVSGTVTANAGTNLNTSALALDATLTGGSLKAQGNVASAATDSGNPVKTGGVFNTTQPTVTTGQRIDVQMSNRGEQLIAKGVSGFSIDNTGFNVNNTPSVAQSGTWTVQPGNTANTTAWKVDGSAVTQPVSGTVTANQGGTWTVQPGNTANTTPWLTTDSADGSTGSAVPAKTSLAGVKDTSGNAQDISGDTNGRPFVKVYPDTTTASYRASKKFAASSTTDNAVMPGNATNTVIVTKVLVTCNQTTAGQINVELLKRSTADTAGTSAAMTAVPMDSNYAAAVSAPLSYTGTGPTVGTPVGDLDNLQIGCMAAATATPNDIFIFHPDKPIILRGTAQQIAVNVGNAALTGGNVTVTFEWQETTTP